MNKEIFPLTVISDRYGGAFSKCKYLAFNLPPHSLPAEIGSDDADEEIGFWMEYDASQLAIGKGETPELAIQDLARILDET